MDETKPQNRPETIGTPPDRQADVTLEAETCRNFDQSSHREWLVTNGVGGFASGAVAGLNTRRYHGHLVAALNPPLGRTVMVSQVDDALIVKNQRHELSCNLWSDGTIAPRGFDHLQRFLLEGSIPCWHFAVGSARLEKRIWMEHGRNTTYVRYDLVGTQTPATIELKVLINYRDYHSLTHGNGWIMHSEVGRESLQVRPYDGARRLRILCPGASFMPAHAWHKRLALPAESARGFDHTEDILHIGTVLGTVEIKRPLILVLDADEGELPEIDGALERRRIRDTYLIDLADASGDSVAERLTLAADQFIVSRPSASQPDGVSVIAGYPWFGDWGRDTMIALPGLMLETGRYKEAASVLRVFAEHVSRGMLPNRFPDSGDEPEYNTVDATLWYFEAIRRYVDRTDDRELLRELMPVLKGIVDTMKSGTRYGIRQDPADGLLFAGELGVQLTWMDAKLGDWVVTPRIGKPIEVNALWLNAAMAMRAFAERLGETVSTFDALSATIRQGIQRFWKADTNYCYDVLDKPNGGNDATLRPNQLIAVSLPIDAFSRQQQKAIVDVVQARLYTPLGIRSLDPAHPDYKPHYQGGHAERDGAYHQGTAWAWLLGPFVEAHWRVLGDREAGLSFLAPIVEHLRDYGMGSICEISDAEPDFAPRGCIAQAWSVAEVLRVLRVLRVGV